MVTSLYASAAIRTRWICSHRAARRLLAKSGKGCRQDQAKGDLGPYEVPSQSSQKLSDSTSLLSDSLRGAPSQLLQPSAAR